MQTFAPDIDSVCQQFALRAQEPLRDKSGRRDVEVACRYIGVVVPGGGDKSALSYKQSRTVFSWIVRTPEWDWDGDLARLVEHVGVRDLPLPTCTVTHRWLADVALESAETASGQFSLTVSCTYFLP